MADARRPCLHRWLTRIITAKKKKKKKKEGEEKPTARNASRSVMHKILNVTAFFHAERWGSARKGSAGRGGEECGSVNEHAAYTYTFLITAHLYVDKRGLAALNKWASLNKLPCIMAYACGPVIPCRYAVAVMRYE